MGSRRARIVLAATLLTLASGCDVPFDPARLACTRFASPRGSDDATGEANAPFLTAAKLLGTLTPGEIGCLRGGEYAEDILIGQPGEAGRPITLMTMPGERARLRGFVQIEAAFVVIENMDLVGTAASPDDSAFSVLGNDVTFRNVDVTTDHQHPCFEVGDFVGSDTSTPPTERFALIDSHVHDCGVLPSTNNGHAVELYNAADALIEGNLIFDNVDGGLEQSPRALRTMVHHNVFDANGENVKFSADYGVATSDCIVTRNVITNSTIRYNVESYYPTGDMPPMGNVVDENCIFGGPEGYTSGNPGAIDPDGAFELGPGNRIIDPVYTDRAAHDFRPRQADCAALLAR